MGATIIGEVREFLFSLFVLFSFISMFHLLYTPLTLPINTPPKKKKGKKKSFYFGVSFLLGAVNNSFLIAHEEKSLFNSSWEVSNIYFVDLCMVCTAATYLQRPM